MKKILALLLVVSMALSLCACGSDQPASNPGHSDNSPAFDEPYTGEAVTNDPTEIIAPVETPDPSSNVPEAQDSSSTAAKPEGLIFMSVNSSDTYRKVITIIAINPDTGDPQTISEFWYGRTVEDGVVVEEYYTPEGDVITPGKGYYSTRREWFNDDYTRMAITRYDYSNSESCAGWLGTDGNFFDVTDTLGMNAKNDFDTPARQIATGFSEDGYFSYMSLAGEGVNAYREYYHVPISSFTTDSVQAGIALAGVGEDFVYHNSARFSDWDRYTGRFLLNTDEGISRLCDDVTDGGMSYVPGNNRLSWNGVFSPDGNSVAFMSKPKTGGSVDVYIMSLNGGDPVKVDVGNLQLATQDECDKGYYVNTNTPCVMLIDWK